MESASVGMLRKARRRGWTFDVGASIVMDKSRAGEVLVANMSCVIKVKKVDGVARTWKMSSLKTVL